MKKVFSKSGSSSKTKTYALVAAGGGFLLASVATLTAQTTLSGNHVVTGDLDVGNTSTKGSLKVNGPTGNSALPGLTVNGDGGVVFKGTEGTGQIPTTSTGSMLMWYPKKMAFRAGHVTGGEWTDGVIGNASMVLGYDSTASGVSSISLGSYNNAAGENAITLGIANEATSLGTVAMGYSNYASGANSMALGYLTSTAGEYSIATGYFTMAQGKNQFVVGSNNIAQGSASSWVSTDDLFIVGNGVNVSSNAFTVKKNGIVSLFGTEGATTASIVLDPTGTPKITIGGQSVLTANSTANFAFAGNLGVGNSGVTNAHSDADNVVVGSTTGTNGLTLLGATNGRSNLFFGDVDNPNIGILSFNHANNKLQIGGAGYDIASAMYLDASGKLGIGTSSPTAQVHVYSGINSEMRVQTTGTSNAATAGINLIGGNAGADWWMLTNRADLASAANSLAFFKGTGTVGTKMVITDGGSVGIATTTPNASYRLDVNGYSGLGGLRVNGNDESNTLLSPTGKQIAINAVAGNGVTVKTTGAVVVGAWNDTAQQKFNVMGTSYFSDNVGVGTTSPTAKLEVAGTVKFAKQGDIPMGEFGLNGD